MLEHCLNCVSEKCVILDHILQINVQNLFLKFKKMCYFNFDEEDELKSVFETNKNPLRIIELLSMIAGEKILPGKTLIIFDEIQECPQALNALKYFREKANNYHVIAAGSLLGTLLAKPNEKFMYGAVHEGGRARDFEEAIEWLVSAGMLNRVYNVSKMEHPLAAFDKPDQFKLFLFDTGLRKHMAGIDNSAILLKSDYQFKGPLTENYVLQQLRRQFAVEPRYFSDKNSEIDFVLQYGTEVISVEAKGGEDKSASSFKRYIADRHSAHAIRFSKRGYRKDGSITNLPLYLARKTKALL